MTDVTDWLTVWQSKAGKPQKKQSEDHHPKVPSFDRFSSTKNQTVIVLIVGVFLKT